METRRTGYGLYEVLVSHAGTVFTGSGLSPQAAEFRARLKAESEPCRGCTVSISRAVAEVSRRVLGAPFCATCREKMAGPGWYDESDAEI